MDTIRPAGKAQMDLEHALNCLGSETEEHWPTVANVLGAEVLRLRSALENAPLAATAEELGHEHQVHLIEAYGSIQAAMEQASGDAMKRTLKAIDGHLRLALNLDPRR